MCYAYVIKLCDNGCSLPVVTVSLQEYRPNNIKNWEIYYVRSIMNSITSKQVLSTWPNHEETIRNC